MPQRKDNNTLVYRRREKNNKICYREIQWMFGLMFVADCVILELSMSPKTMIFYVVIYVLCFVFVVYNFGCLFYLMRKYHHFEFNRHKKSLVSYFIIFVTLIVICGVYISYIFYLGKDLDKLSNYNYMNPRQLQRYCF
jgi:uncharacterized membrane protein